MKNEIDVYFLEGFYLGGDGFFTESNSKEELEEIANDYNLVAPQLFVRYNDGTEKQIEFKMNSRNAKEKLSKVKILLRELIELGESYAHFQSAQITHKNLKKSLKLLTNIS